MANRMSQLLRSPVQGLARMARGAGLVALAALVLAAMDRAVLAGPMQCITTLEAPPPAGAPAGSATATMPPGPVEVTRCLPIETTDELVLRRAYTWRPPFVPGISMVHQVTDLLGIANGGASGYRWMGFGFPEQTLIWDGSAIEATYLAQLRLLSRPMPLRTADLNSTFTTSLGSAAVAPAASPLPSPPGDSWDPGVRGLW